MSKEDVAREAKWEAESDAKALVEAAAIRADSKRLGAAEKAAKRMGKEEAIKNRAMQDLGNGKWPLNYNYDEKPKES